MRFGSVRAYRRGMLRLAPLLLLAVALAGCPGGAGRTKSGVRSTHAVTLKMPVPDSDDVDAAAFAADVSRRTHGHVRIVLDKTGYSSVNPDNELQLVKDLRSGRVPIAYVPSRAWERDGINAMQALQAPFLIGDYDVLERVTSGDIGRSMLQSLDRAGLVGLALVPKELRRPLGTAAAGRRRRLRRRSHPRSHLAGERASAGQPRRASAHRPRCARGPRRTGGADARRPGNGCRRRRQ